MGSTLIEPFCTVSFFVDWYGERLTAAVVAFLHEGNIELFRILSKSFSAGLYSYKIQSSSERRGEPCQQHQHRRPRLSSGSSSLYPTVKGKGWMTR